MKKLFGVFTVFLLVGAGCFGGGIGGGGNEVAEDLVEGDWWLVFDLPEGWGMYAHYQEDVVDPSSHEVNRDLQDVVVQSSTLPIVLEGEEAEENVTEFVDADYTYIRVFRFDPRTSVPADAEQLDENFYKRVRDDGSVAYYVVGENGKYKAVVNQEDQDISVAEEILRTAVEVTAL